MERGIVSTALEATQLTSFAEDEELQVTYQVGLVGSDGIILASDTRQMYVVGATENNPYAPHQPSEVSKFLRSEDGCVIATFAGSPTSKEVAGQIVAAVEKHSLAPLDFERAVCDISDKIRPPLGSRDEIMIVRLADPPKILLLSRWPHVNRTTEQTTWITTGDNSGPSRFFAHHFYRKRPIAELRILAALILKYASLENPTGIGGAEMWEATADGIKQIDASAAVEDAEKFRLQIESAILAGIYPISS
jgi:hypothetical protein